MSIHLDDDINEDLSFDFDELNDIANHRNTVSAFDEKLMLWIQAVGREVISGCDDIDEDMLDAFMDAHDEDSDDDALLILVAVNSVDHWLEIDPRDGEISTTDDTEIDLKVYATNVQLLMQPTELAEKLIQHIEAWYDTDDDEEENDA